MHHWNSFDIFGEEPTVRMMRIMTNCLNWISRHIPAGYYTVQRRIGLRLRLTMESSRTNAFIHSGLVRVLNALVILRTGAKGTLSSWRKHHLKNGNKYSRRLPGPVLC